MTAPLLTYEESNAVADAVFITGLLGRMTMFGKEYGDTLRERLIDLRRDCQPDEEAEYEVLDVLIWAIEETKER